MGVRLHVRSGWASGNDDEVVYELDQDRILIGRGRGADVCLPHRAVSLRHATIELSGRRYTITDHESTNGTRVSEARLVPSREKPLRDHDRIEIGGFTIVFRCDVPVTTPTSVDRTRSLARRLLRGALAEDEAELRPELRVLNGPGAGDRVALPDPPSKIVIGRGEHCQLRLADADASREHAEIEVTADGARIRDLGSKNGIEVAGRACHERALAHGDEIRIGATVIAFDDPTGARVRALEEGDDELAESPPAPEPVPAPEPAIEAPESDEPPPPAKPKPKPSIAPADLVIYVLASAIFAASVLGLIWLLRS